MILWYVTTANWGAGSVCIQPPFSWRLAPSTESDVNRVVMLEKSRSISTPFWNPKSTAKEKALQENTIFKLKKWYLLCFEFYLNQNHYFQVTLLETNPPPLSRDFSPTTSELLSDWWEKLWNVNGWNPQITHLERINDLPNLCFMLHPRRLT